MMAGFVKQIQPVCSVLAGVTLAMALIENRQRQAGAVHTAIIVLLTVSSMLMLAALCTASMYLAVAGFPENLLALFPGETLGEFDVEGFVEEFFGELTLGMSLMLVVAIIGTYLGIASMVLALGLSGFARSRRNGIWTMSAAVIGFLMMALPVVAM
ncbi:MAG: hypothetical protein OXI79_03510 [Gammaproteobacteria bacterium]|nr:hypothetical protein [Gammaproteobacteria bacterium]